jgi:type I restriction enzyme S subunit
MKLLPLKDFCKMYQPPTISTKELIPDGDYVVYGANGVIGRYNKFNHEEPQLLVTCRGATCGAVNMSEPFSWINGNAMVIQPDLKIASLEYMKYAFLGGIDVSSSITGSAQPQITRTTLEVIKVPLPSLEKQRAIVEKLDSAFAEIDLLETNLGKSDEKANQLLQSLLSAAFTSSVSSKEPSNSAANPGLAMKNMKLVKLSDLFRVGSSKRVLKSDWKDAGVPFYRGREITRLSKTGFADNELFISEEHFKDLSAKYGVPVPGDIMVTAIGTIGNTYVVNERDRFYFKDASVLWLHKEAEVDSRFIDYWLKSDLFFDQLDRGNGATVDTLTIEKLSNVKLLLPSPEKQRDIVEKLDSSFDEIDLLKVQIKIKKDYATALRQSLLSSAFTQEEAVA